MVNYKKGLIYKLCCDDTNIKEEYVGSTVDFTERKRCHKKSCNSPDRIEYNYNVYKFIRKNGGFENWSMVLVEKYPCNDKRELETRERYWIEKLKCKLNCKIPQRTRKEHYQDNKEDLKKIHSIYYQENKDDISKKGKEKITCECGTIVRKNDLSRHYNSNKHLKYLEDGIVIFYAITTDNEKITCECGIEVLKKKHNINRHRQTKKHINLMIIKNNPQEEKKN